MSHQESSPAAIHARGLATGHNARALVSRDLDLHIAPGAFTVIVGPNACGKSTLLRSLSRVLPSQAGVIHVEGNDAATLRPRAFAQRVGLLPQSAVAPAGIRVADLVERGRHPHQTMLRQRTRADADAVAEAMRIARVEDLAELLVEELSGGQRQRVWVAMLLAQQTPIMLLDEPTTYLDIAHQFELLDLLNGFRRSGRTVVAVLHDLNQAARYATQLVVMKDGRIVADGPPIQVLTAKLVRDVFGLDVIVADDPASGTPAVFPIPQTSPGMRLGT